jgi:hypothetical protein
MGTEIKRQAAKAVMGTHGGIRVPWLEVVEGKLHERDKTGPEIEWESDVNRSKSGDDVIFGSTYEAFSWIGTAVVGGYMLDETRDGRRGKKFPKGRRTLVVRNKVSDDVTWPKSLKKPRATRKEETCVSSFFLSILLAVYTCITLMCSHQYKLHPIP